MNKIQLFNVAPSLPSELEFLEVLENNMWWCWNLDAVDLFRRIDPQLWKSTRHNPFNFLSSVSQKRLDSLAEDDGYLSHLDQVKERFETEVLDYGRIEPSVSREKNIAYFSLEYGIHESLKIYSGGLGGLAGDHLKSASDMNVPLVAVGLLYRCGYFQQYLNNEGWQQEACVENEIHRLPLKRACDANNNQIQIQIPLPDGVLKAIVWRVDVGRISLYLLDTNIPENTPEHRNICTHLYDADKQKRLRQELLLGIGGFRALLELGFDPYVYHMNEGHAAFISLARLAHLVKNKGLTFDAAMEIVSRTNLFTTHTPVPAGNETFSVDLLKPHLEALKQELGINPDDIISWGNAPGKSHPQEITMTILALRMSRFANGVSRLHGEVSRKMWAHLWPSRPKDEIPITHVTNGVHVTSWLSQDNAVLLDRYLGPDWRDNPSNSKMLARIEQIPDEEFWRAHELGRAKLISACRELGEQQMNARNASASEIAEINSVFNHNTLTIGFARRFAEYKRATLLLRHPERLEALLTNSKRPVQMVFAGKAHPADDIGKNFIREIIKFAHRPNIRKNVIFLENYDIRIARYMVQGVDVWLNNPRRPQEASGTSGMKATINGALHLSILDGWWDEAYDPAYGWAIGRGEEYDNLDYQDVVESQALFNLMENEVVPCFYERSNGDVPRKWIKMMKASMIMSLHAFSSHRMVADYREKLYGPALSEHEMLWANGADKASVLVKQHIRLNTLWNNVRISAPVTDREIEAMHVGDKFEVTTIVELGELKPDEVDVEVYYGPVDSNNQISESHAQKMNMEKDNGNNSYVYKQIVTCDASGRYGLTARVKPHGTDWKGIIPGFLTWAN